MMNKAEKEELNPPLSILKRLDRLDRLLAFLEENPCLSARYHAVANGTEKSVESEENKFQSLSSAPEEVQHKGTLIERVSLLENKVIQLSLAMDVGNTSRSSCSPTAAAGHGTTSMAEGQNANQDPFIPSESSIGEACSLNSASCRGQRRGRKSKKKPKLQIRCRRWLKWIQLGC